MQKLIESVSNSEARSSSVERIGQVINELSLLGFLLIESRTFAERELLLGRGKVGDFKLSDKTSMLVAENS